MQTNNHKLNEANRGELDSAGSVEVCSILADVPDRFIDSWGCGLLLSEDYDPYISKLPQLLLSKMKRKEMKTQN